jgi:hypothetical protein
MTKARDKQAKIDPLASSHADGSTRRPETPELEGRIPLPEELTGRASGTDDDLVALFDNTSVAHLTDGFRGGSDDEADLEEGAQDTDIATDDAEIDEEIEAERP